MIGFADLHNHQFAHLAFGGLAFHGRPSGDIQTALPFCEPVHGPLGLLDVLGNTLKAASGGSILGHRVEGYPAFDGWPRWDSITHQSVHEDWLLRAVDGGLRLLVMLAVNNEHLCKLSNHNLSCNDMEAVDRQLEAAKQLEASIDARHGGPGRGWYRIVRTPAEARASLAAGKLAVVLGVEVDYLFNCRKQNDLTEGELRQVLDKYYQIGVRHLFAIHFADNGFGGSAFQNQLQRSDDPAKPNPLPSPLNPLGTLDWYRLQTEDARADGYLYRTGQRNVRGLTALGKLLIAELISRGMIVEVDHMSAHSKADTLDICEQAGYPAVSGHTGFVDVSAGNKRHEGQLRAPELARIRKTGGMVSAIVHQGNLDEIVTWIPPDQPGFTHTCGNSSNTFVQAYLYAVVAMQGGAVGLGTDFNGFAGLIGPRFGPDACRGGGKPVSPALQYPFLAEASGHSLSRSVVGQKTFDFNLDGLAHVGMLPDLIADLQVMGVQPRDLAPLLSSAESYVSVWERCFSFRRP